MLVDCVLERGIVHGYEAVEVEWIRERHDLTVR